MFTTMVSRLYSMQLKEKETQMDSRIRFSQGLLMILVERDRDTCNLQDFYLRKIYVFYKVLSSTFSAG